MNYTPPSPPFDSEEIRHLLLVMEKVARRNPVRETAEQILADRNQMLESLNPLQRSLAQPEKRGWRERYVAAWSLGHARLHPALRKTAIETLTDLLAKRLEPSLTHNILRAIWFTVIFCFLIPLAPPLLTVYIPILVLFNRYYRKKSVLVRAEAARSLGEMEAVESLEILVYAIIKDRRVVRIESLRALYRVLPHLTSAHYGTLRSETIQSLCRIMAGTEENLAICILDAFSFIGDQITLPYVERLAAGRGRARMEPRIQQAAAMALPNIHARILHGTASRTLLRASQMDQTRPDQLLRPAEEAGSNNPLELLRGCAKDPQANPDLTMAILQDLKKQGDSRAIPVLREMLELHTSSPEVKQAAQDCISTLLAIQELTQYAPITSQPPILLQRNDANSSGESSS